MGASSRADATSPPDSRSRCMDEHSARGRRDLHLPVHTAAILQVLVLGVAVRILVVE